MYERILVTTDGSTVAEHAVDHAVDLASTYDAELHALYVVDLEAVTFGLGTEQAERLRQGQFGEMDELREKAERATGYVRERAEANGVTVTEVHVGGQPHERIADYAETNDIDLVVMGSRGRGGIKRALLGSVTERTLRSTTVPVLVVDYRSSDEDE